MPKIGKPKPMVIVPVLLIIAAVIVVFATIHQ